MNQPDRPVRPIDEFHDQMMAKAEAERQKRAAASAVVSPPTDRADLRDRIAEVLRTTPSAIGAENPQLGFPSHHQPGESGYLGWCALCVRDVDALADAVLSVLPEPTDRAAVARVRALHQQYTFGDGTTDYCAHCNQIRGGWVPWPCPTVRALDVELAVEAQSCRWEHPHPGYQCEPRTAVEAHDTGTQQPAAVPAETEWLVQTRWHDGDWRDWSRRISHGDAVDEYERAQDGKHDWRLVRVTTSYVVEATTEPAPVAQQPAAADGEETHRA